MKEKWMAPKTVIEEFTPNEYVAACWGVACDWEEANKYEKRHHFWDNGNVSHAADHCGNEEYQKIILNSKGDPVSMIETGTDGLGDLHCTIYKYGGYSSILPIDQVKAGMKIFWTTTSGSRTWHHQGTVVGTVPSNPNLS